MRMRVTTTWLAVIAVLVLGAGAVAASDGYRRITAMDDRALEAEAALRARNAVIARLTAEVEALQAQLSTTVLEAKGAAAALRTTQGLLKETTDQLRSTEEKLGAQQADMSTLRTCLTGTLHALQMMADGDAYGAMYYMVTVDGPCRTARRLLNVQGTTN